MNTPPVRVRHWTARACIAGALLMAGCSDAGTQLEATAPSVQGATQSTTTSTTESTTTASPPTTASPATTAPTSETSEPAEELTPTGLSVPLLIFGDSIRRIDPDGTQTLVERDDAVRVAGDSQGGVVFQRELIEGPQSSILWQPLDAAVPSAVFIPRDDQQIELHGVTTVTDRPEAVFSVTSSASTSRSLNRIDLETLVVTELAVVDDAEFGSKSTQVDGPFIVTTWEREATAGWTVYQSGTGRAVGGSFPDVEAQCGDGRGWVCAKLASLSLDIQSVFRITPNSNENIPGQYDLLITRAENGSQVARYELGTLGGVWYPEHLSELPDGKILLSRSVDPDRLRPTTGVVISKFGVD